MPPVPCRFRNSSCNSRSTRNTSRWRKKCQCTQSRNAVWGCRWKNQLHWTVQVHFATTPVATRQQNLVIFPEVREPHGCNLDVHPSLQCEASQLNCPFLFTTTRNLRAFWGDRGEFGTDPCGYIAHRTAKPEAYPKLGTDACGGLRQRTNQKTAIAFWTRDLSKVWVPSFNSCLRGIAPYK